MIKMIKTFIAVAALSGTVGANVHAEEVTVHKGDTLWNISQIHNASVENINNWNNLSSNIIRPGDLLKVLPVKHYVVKEGDTLWDIAKENNVMESQLMGWNNLTTDLIKPGLNLDIYDNKKEIGVEKQVKAAESTPVSTQAVAKSKQSVQETKQPAPKINTVTKVNNKPVPVKKANNKVITVKATAYTASCKGCSGVTRTGVDLKSNPNSKVISVDPTVIPLGSKVYVEGYGYATAADTGGAIKGNRIDVFIPSQSNAIQFGAKQLKVTILN
ncbi:MAG TPA: LysM peptidoglycan-binding domain-containing protein [Bacillales bacterium]|nr:LysM peptidoglycan-binding domain-containing protein [Bacillales bacterium]